MVSIFCRDFLFEWYSRILMCGLYVYIHLSQARDTGQKKILNCRWVAISQVVSDKTNTHIHLGIYIQGYPGHIYRERYISLRNRKYSFMISSHRSLFKHKFPTTMYIFDHIQSRINLTLDKRYRVVKKNWDQIITVCFCC